MLDALKKEEDVSEDELDKYTDLGKSPPPLNGPKPLLSSAEKPNASAPRRSSTFNKLEACEQIKSDKNDAKNIISKYLPDTRHHDEAAMSGDLEHGQPMGDNAMPSQVSR